MTLNHRRKTVELRGFEPLASRVRFLRRSSGMTRRIVTTYGHFSVSVRRGGVGNDWRAGEA